LKKINDARDANVENSGGGERGGEIGKLQSSLTKRKGTVSIIAEYKRKLSGSGFLSEVPSPALLSPVFREFGASAVSVLADERTGGCNYEDVSSVVTEQRDAMGEVPGPLPVICSDVIVDEIQIARAKDAGCDGITLNYGLIGGDMIKRFVCDARSIDLECIIVVSTKEEANDAVYECGATILCVSSIVDTASSKREVVSDFLVRGGGGGGGGGDATKDDHPTVCLVASVVARGNKAMEEVEESWELRDMGFNAVWVSDALYKSGNDPVEHPGAIINSMRAKSSVKYASPKARSGKGEGAREYLGDILM
jgi:indole-3-glycerol phosphate synthase